MNSQRTTYKIMWRQRGAALMVMLVILIMGITTFLVSSLSSSALQTKRDEATSKALAQAKEALIGYAASVKLTGGAERPGDLPCPDNHPLNDPLEGSPSPCNANALGRLPWKKLGLPDLRDGSGERLWYAVSANFENDPRSGTLNSDTVGTISIFASNGSLLNDGGASGTGAVAVVISPGDVLQRTDQTSLQDRSSANYNIAKNFLDTALTKDNANFTDGSSNAGFIQGRIKDASGNVILNDQLLVITQDNIMLAIQKRVAAEVRQCLNEYANDPQNSGRYPWAVLPANYPSYMDGSSQLFGRIPDTPFSNTCVDSGGWSSGHLGNNCSLTGTPLIGFGMKNSWTGNCNINSASGWWLNWKELVFYGLADAYKPVNPPSTLAACPTCLTVNPPSVLADKKLVVIVAGKMLPGLVQTRALADRGTVGNYLEAPNSGGLVTFAQSGVSATFNDTLVFP
jgi:hypothetical protein